MLRCYSIERRSQNTSPIPFIDITRYHRCRARTRDYLCPRLDRARTWRGFRLPHRGKRHNRSQRRRSTLPRRCSTLPNTLSSPSTGMWQRWHLKTHRTGKSPERTFRSEHLSYRNRTGTKIREYLLKHGAPDVLMPTTEAQLSYIDSNRKFVHPRAFLKRMRLRAT